MSNLLLSTPQTETDAVYKRMLFLSEEKFVEVLAFLVESGGEGFVLFFKKVQIAILCLPPHLLQEYSNLQDTSECPFSKHKKHKPLHKK